MKKTTWLAGASALAFCILAFAGVPAVADPPPFQVLGHASHEIYYRFYVEQESVKPGREFTVVWEQEHALSEERRRPNGTYYYVSYRNLSELAFNTRFADLDYVIDHSRTETQCGDSSEGAFDSVPLTATGFASISMFGDCSIRWYATLSAGAEPGVYNHTANGQLFRGNVHYNDDPGFHYGNYQHVFVVLSLNPLPITVVADAPPTISIAPFAPPVNGTYSAAITLSDFSSDFIVTDLTVTNATATMTGSGKDYVVTLTPTASGEGTLSVAAGTFSDPSGDFNEEPSNLVKATFDADAPTISIAELTGPVAGAYSAAITLSEDSTDFTVDDLTPTNASATLSGAGSSYTAVLTPLADGPVALSVGVNTFSDAAGLFNTVESNTVTTLHDTAAPTVSIEDFTGPLNGDQSAIIALSEDSTDFTVEDLTLTNANATLTGGGSSYIAVVTPLADGPVTLSVAANRFSDAAGNFNTNASNEVTIVFDGTSPTVTVSTAATSFSGASVLDVAVVFSEEVTGFDASDVVVTNGSATSVTGSGMEYRVSVAATGNGDVEISIPEAAAADAAGNPSLASNALTVSNATVEETQRIIAQFMQTRANLLISSQPDLVGYLSGQNRPGSFNADAADDGGAFNFASSSMAGSNLWMHLNGTWANEDTRESRDMFGAIGTHYPVSSGLLLGTMAQFDHLSQNNGESRTEGTGWMIGPYFVAKMPEQPLFFESHLLYGQTSNEVSPFGTYTDSFETERMLAMFKVAGKLEYGATTWTPSAQLSYTTDDQKAYTDGLGNTIPVQGVALGQFELGLDFSHNIALNDNDAVLELTGGVAAIMSSISGSGNADLIVPEFEGDRAKVSLGANYSMTNGSKFSVDTFYDGIGVREFESFGVQSRIRFSF